MTCSDPNCKDPNCDYDNEHAPASRSEVRSDEAEHEQLMFRVAERAYFKAAEFSDPQDWLQAGLMAQQHRNALTKLRGAAQAQQVPKSVVPEGMKPVYLKPWRTIFMIPAGIADAVRDTINAPSPLAWLAEHSNYEITYSGWDEDPVWQVHSVNGGRNDREWKLLTTGKTPEEAIKKAMALSLPSATRDGFGNRLCQKCRLPHSEMAACPEGLET